MRVQRLLFSGLLLILSGCETTTELTQAPFNATTDISDGVMRATSDLTAPIRDFTSSTTPGAWFNGNNLAKSRQKVEVFTAYSFENLRADISRGDGEYLVSLAALAGVPPLQQQGFRLQMQQAYTTLYEENITSKESAARVVNAAWTAGHGDTGQRSRSAAE